MKDVNNKSTTERIDDFVHEICKDSNWVNMKISVLDYMEDILLNRINKIKSRTVIEFPRPKEDEDFSIYESRVSSYMKEMKRRFEQNKLG